MEVGAPHHRRRHPRFPPLHVRIPVLHLHAPRMALRQHGCHVPPSVRLALGFWDGCCTFRAYLLRPRLCVAYGTAEPVYGGSGARRGGKGVDV